MADDHTEGDTGLVSLGLHADASAVRLAGSEVRRQARVRPDDVGFVAEHRVGTHRRQDAPVPTAVATVHRRYRLGKSSCRVVRCLVSICTIWPRPPRWFFFDCRYGLSSDLLCSH